MIVVCRLLLAVMEKNNENVVAVVEENNENVVVVMVVGLPPFQTVPFSQKCQLFRFEHPFTSMIGEMAGSGKTAWVRSPLQQACKLQRQFTLHQRIVWCYSQWQPAYTEMLVAMPHTGFVKGIPTALEQDSYFDVNKWNLIMFDDQMIDAS